MLFNNSVYIVTFIQYSKLLPWSWHPGKNVSSARPLLNEKLYLEMAEQISVHSMSFNSISVRFKHISELPEEAELVKKINQ